MLKCVCRAVVVVVVALSGVLSGALVYGQGAVAEVNGSVTDRPVKGRDDLLIPIVSPVDANGMAIRNGIKGNNKMLLDMRLQYVHQMGSAGSAGFYWEIYNATNRVNFGPPVGIRNASNFMQAIVADAARSMQLDVRVTF